MAGPDDAARIYAVHVDVVRPGRRGRLGHRGHRGGVVQIGKIREAPILILPIRDMPPARRPPAARLAPGRLAFNPSRSAPVQGGPSSSHSCYRRRMDEQLEFLRLIAARLQAAGIPYMVTGSLALAVWAVPRMTRDIDVVVEVEAADAQRLIGLFAEDCVIDEDAAQEAIARRGTFNVIHAEWIVKADFIVRKDAAYRKVELDRRRWLEVAGTAIAFVSPEDLILSKLVWGEDSHSELQHRDVRQLVQSVQDLDWGYLHTWAVELGVRDALERIEGS